MNSGDIKKNVNDILWAMEHRGNAAAFMLAATRGDMESFKQSLKLTYGIQRVCVKVLNELCDTFSETAYNKIEGLLDIEPDDSPELYFWAQVVEIHERGMLEGENE